MLYEMFVATIILSWIGACLALITMGIFYSDKEEIPPRVFRVFAVLAFIGMATTGVISSWAC